MLLWLCVRGQRSTWLLTTTQQENHLSSKCPSGCSTHAQIGVEQKRSLGRKVGFNILLNSAAVMLAKNKNSSFALLLVLPATKDGYNDSCVRTALTLCVLMHRGTMPRQYQDTVGFHKHQWKACRTTQQPGHQHDTDGTPVGCQWRRSGTPPGTFQVG